MAHVITASKGVADISYLQRNRKFFKTEGYQSEEVDLDNKKEPEIDY